MSPSPSARTGRVLDAVTAVLTCGDTLYITRRQPQLPAFPGYWAFPGGKVDRSDSDVPFDHPLMAAHPPRLMRALTRELKEETAFDLPAACDAGTVKAIHCLGEATTPPFQILRFRTWFFRLELSERPRITPDPGEVAESTWLSARELTDRYLRGRLLVVPPTRAVADRIRAQPDAGLVPELSRERFTEGSVPVVEPLGGLHIALVRSNTIPPADRTNAFLVGDEGCPRILIDPSPADAAEYAALVETLADDPPDEIFLTHHHPDHRERADALARHYGVPMTMSDDTRDRIHAKTGGRYFKDIEVRTRSEGDRLTEWQGEPVTVFPVPGHDAGQLAVMPASREWCIVSDLYQGVGTVVVGGPESSMRDYFASLERVIELDPKVVIPSHGMASGTTHRLRETLAHRQLRERQVQQLHDDGVAPQDMVPKLYKGLDPRLLPLARMNVESHLDKLREEGAIA